MSFLGLSNAEKIAIIPGRFIPYNRTGEDGFRQILLFSLSLCRFGLVRGV